MQYKLCVEYDGTNYFGWQKQRNQITIQETIEKALSVLLKEKVKILGAGRTDTGVHAINQYFTFRTEKSLPDSAFIFGLNHLLPEDIRIKKVERVSDDFHVIISAKKKTYIYKILNRFEPTALDRNRCWHIYGEINLEAMNQCAKLILGRKDFRAFRSSICSRLTTERTVYEAFWKKEGDYLIFQITADGFLHNMVRILVGTMVDVGMGKLTVTDFKNILEKGDRKKAGKTAPPQGLYLYEVFY
ncbi:MAG: tRNA pseudouridine(38-40) synthase TruA [Proteobacteria bacterium]|nr:tRNA pseudouridine(38-40) synthase TruA [Pseudomonadota bacterium]